MKEVIKKIKRGIVNLKNRIVWKRQYKKLMAMPRRINFEQNEAWFKDKRILMMVPHADDELISSYTVLYNTDKVVLYYCGFTGSNHTEKNRGIRRNELLRLCSEMNVRVIEGEGNCDNLEDVLSHGKFDTVLLPSIVDWHEEHRKISYMIGRICVQQNLMPDIYAYSVTVPNESNKNVICCPFSAEQQLKKYDLFKKFYLSQKFMPLERLKLNEKINGYYAGCFAAEVFIKYDFNKWSKMVFQLEPLEKDAKSQLRILSSELYSTLNDLVLVRQSSSAFYSWLEQEMM